MVNGLDTNVGKTKSPSASHLNADGSLRCGSTAVSFFNEQDNRDRLNQAGLRAILRAIAKGSGVAPEWVLPALGFWSHFNKKAASLWLRSYLQNRAALTAYLDSITSISEGTGGTRRFIYVASFEKLITVKELEKRRDKYFVGELTPEEAELAKLLKVGITAPVPEFQTLADISVLIDASMSDMVITHSAR